LPGLLAIGEVACTGLHGANRLASNSLLEGLVFGHRAADAVRGIAAESPRAPSVPDWDPGRAVPSDEGVIVKQNWDEIRQLMWNYVGIVRTDKRLARAQRRLDNLVGEIQEYYWGYLVDRDLLELRNLADVARLIVACAQERKESRGLHYTLSWPAAARRGIPCWCAARLRPRRGRGEAGPSGVAHRHRLRGRQVHSGCWGLRIRDGGSRVAPRARRGALHPVRAPRLRPSGKPGPRRFLRGRRAPLRRRPASRAAVPGRGADVPQRHRRARADHARANRRGRALRRGR